MNKQLEALMVSKGFSKEEFTSAILDKILADGVRLNDFTNDQKQKIIITYAAAMLAAA
jgi:hypothetical protein